MAAVAEGEEGLARAGHGEVLVFEDFGEVLAFLRCRCRGRAVCEGSFVSDQVANRDVLGGSEGFAGSGEAEGVIGHRVFEDGFVVVDRVCGQADVGPLAQMQAVLQRDTSVGDNLPD